MSEDERLSPEGEAKLKKALEALKTEECQPFIPVKEEPILQHADGTLVKIITNWKEYPHDQFMRETVLGRIQQAFFKPPTNCPCGGEMQRLKIEEGWVYKCDKCGDIMPDASHQVFWTNHEQIIHLV
jgi:hypothetical protein